MAEGGDPESTRSGGSGGRTAPARRHDEERQSTAEAIVAAVQARPHTTIMEAQIKALEDAPKKTVTMLKLLAVDAHRRKDLQAALKIARQIFASQPNSENAKNVALILSQIKRPKEAIAFLKDVETLIDPALREDMLALLHRDLGDNTAAAMHGAKALEIKDAMQSHAPPLKPVLSSFDPEQRHQNVIAFSLWGADDRYLSGAITNAIVARYLYPGWTCRFYVDASVGDDMRQALMKEGADIVDAPEDWPSTSHGLFWRFLVESDPSVALYLVRDADSVMNIKERAAVEDWLQSGKAFHVMRDRPAHSELMLAGMWGAHRGNLGAIKQAVERYVSAAGAAINHRTIDQEFLRKVIWPIVRQDVLAHDGHHGVMGAVPFRSEFSLPGTMHIGQNDWVMRRRSRR